MKILRPAAAAAVLSASFAFSAASEAADADAINVSPQTAPITQAVDSTHSVARTYEQIRADVSTAEFTGDEMLGRIDSLVSRIDSLMKSVTENNNELMQLRNASLQMRGEVVEFLGGNGSQLVQFQTALPPVESIIAGTDGQFGGEVVGTEGSVPVSTPRWIRFDRSRRQWWRWWICRRRWWWRIRWRRRRLRRTRCRGSCSSCDC